MTEKKLHPSVEQFKHFVNSNKKIMEEVRSGRSTLQDLYEEWYLLGEDDPRWTPLLTENKSDNVPSKEKTEWYHPILNSLKNMDPKQMHQYIGNLSQAIGAIQGVLGQFQGETINNQQSPSNDKPKNPFVFRKD